MTISWAAHPAASLVKLFGVALHLQTLARSRSTSLSAEYEYGLPVTIGGVALNCVGDGRILREGLFEKIWVQPAAGDAGGAIGAALLAWHHYEDKPRSVTGERDAQRGSFLGPTFDAREFLRSRRIANVELTDEELPLRVAALLAEGKVVGWY